MATGYVTHPDCSLHDPGWAQPEHQGRLPAVARAVYRDMLTLFPVLVEIEGRPSTPEEVGLAHDPAYVARLRARGDAARRAGRSLDFDGVSVSGGSWAAARAAAGCAVTAVEAVLAGEVTDAFCAVRPPGHGAGSARAGQHGLVNSVAVAAAHLRRRRGLERVLVVDLGARSGLGTAEILASDPGVRLLLVSPDAGGLADGERVLAAPLPADAGADATLAAQEAGLACALRGFDPDFVLLSLGFDLLAADPTSSLRLEPPDYHAVTERLRAAAAECCGGRLVSVLEEGYDPAGLGAGVVQHLRGLAGLPAA